MDYKRSQFRHMVAEADLHLSGKCPLIEDEAIVWAGERLDKLERIELERVSDMQQDRRTQNMQEIEWNDRDLLAEIARLRSAIKKTIENNLHLADGNNCTLIELKRAINYDDV